MPDCPTPHDLEQLLVGESLEPSVQAHVAGCRPCQAVLETLSDDPALEQWLAGRKPPPWEDPKGIALDHLLDQLRGQPPRTRTTRRGTISLAFLEPPRHEGDLGALGPYRILTELGRGGMGIVFKAFDDDLQRSVAVKVLHPDLTEAEDRRRFLREARIAARFRHDHVVTVHAVVNPPEGQPYLVMEYLEGPALSTFIRTQGCLKPPEAVALMVQVADGLAAAHAAGLIHRDVKPSNILLAVVSCQLSVVSKEKGASSVLTTDNWQLTTIPKITDFGLARFADQPSTMTREGFLAGTPAYMSPEQAQGMDVDQRTDVYSLGVTLYEALTGAVPFRGAPHLVLQQVVREEPRPPRQLNDAIPRDLETICLKALAKEPGRRYQSAQELADDLRRWQRGEPIRARPVGLLERLGRWSRRNPRVAGLLVALVLTFLVGFAGVVWQWQRAEATAREADYQRHLAEVKAAEAEQQRGLAEDHLRQACRVVDQFYTQVSASALLKQPGTQPLRRQLLQQALAFYQDFLTRRGDAIFLQEETAQAARNVAVITQQIGTTAEAEAAFQQAIDRYQRLVDAQPTQSSWQMKLAECYLHRGLVLTQAGRLHEALAASKRAAMLMEALARDHPADISIQGNRCACYGNIANLESKLDQRDAARATYEYLRTFLEQLLRDHPHRRGPFRNLGLTENNLALILPSEESIACLKRARDVREQLVCVDPTSWMYCQDLARTDANLGLRLTLAGHDAEALVSYQRAIATLESLAGENPAVKDLQKHLAQAYLNQAVPQQKLHQGAEALVSLEKARELYRALRRDDPRDSLAQDGLALVCRELGQTYRELGRMADAAAVFQEGRHLRPGNAWELLHLAWELTLCIPRTAPGNKVGTPADARLRRQLASQVVASLREAAHLFVAPPAALR